MDRSKDSSQNNRSVIIKFTQFIIEKQNLALIDHDFFSIALDIRHHGNYFILNILEETLLNDENIFKQIQWSKWKIYFVSEHLVPLMHSMSHYSQFNNRILKPMIHKYNHLNLGPTVITIDENNLDLLDQKNIGVSHLIEEFTDLLPKSFDLMILSPFIELDLSKTGPAVTIDDNRIILNYPSYKKCKNICFIFSLSKSANQSTPNENSSIIIRDFKTKITLFKILI